MIVIPTTQRLLSLEDIRVNLLDTGSLRLYQNNFTPSPTSVLGDFTVATFDGYANKAIAAWGAVFLDPLGLATTIAPLQTFTMTGATTPNIVYGAYYLDKNGALMWAERFAVPVNFAAAGNTLPLVPKFQMGNIAA